MKTIEEKARAYDIIIEKANKMHSENCEACKACIEELIPELAKSEGEKIKKRITLCLEECVHSDVIRDYEKDECIAWLEKQGEHANFRDKIQVGDKVTRNEDGVLVNLSQLNRVAKPEENKGNIGGISPNSEWCEENEPHKELAESYLAKFDEKFPILPTLKGKQLADYKNFLNKCQQIFRLKYWGIRPIQAELFEKLSLLWATWGAEHLQGLGQTDGNMDNEMSMWSEEDKKIINGLIDSLTRISLNTRTDSTSPNYTFYKEITWLKSLKPQKCLIPSEEEIEKAAQEWDSKANFNPFYMTMEGNKPTGVKQDITTHEESFKAGVNWILKSLKGRVQSKQEWSDEDETVLNNLIYALANDRIGNNRDEYVAWLKSLRPQNKWKPSDEQMEALYKASKNEYLKADQYDVLLELWNNLKKLKEE